MKHTELWNTARKLKLGSKFLENLDTLLTSLESDNKQLIITDVVHWLPFEEENYVVFKEISNKNKLLKKYDDGTILKDGDEEPLAIMTHFAELT